jgi:hypothetical protein
VTAVPAEQTKDRLTDTLKTPDDRAAHQWTARRTACHSLYLLHAYGDHNEKTLRSFHGFASSHPIAGEQASQVNGLEQAVA